MPYYEYALDTILDKAFYQSNRQHAMLLFSPGLRDDALQDVANLPGVLVAEGQQFQPATLRHGHLEKDTAIEARAPGADLSRIVDAAGHVIDAPPGASARFRTRSRPGAARERIGAPGDGKGV